MRTHSFQLILVLLVGQAAVAQRRPPATGLHWVGTWASAQQQPRSFRGGRGGGQRGPQQNNGPAATPGQAAAPGAGAVAPIPGNAAPNQGPGGPGGPAGPTGGRAGGPGFGGPPQSFHNQTLRMIVRVSAGGSRMRVHLSNAFGTIPLVVGAAHVALHGKGSAILENSDRPLAFNGKGSVTIPPGAEMISDPVALKVPPLGELALSVYVPEETGPASDHFSSFRTTWISKEGDQTGAPEFTDASTLEAWFWISGVDVEAPAAAETIVAFGDSITDGATSTVDAERSWPSVLASRLQASPATAHLAVVNEGIGGNRILSDQFGVNALARFDRDVLGIPGVKWVILLEGINDLNAPPAGGIFKPVGAEELIGAMKQMVQRAHDHGIKVMGGTLTPYGRATPNVETQRQALNEFIRHGGVFDGVADFEQATKDPQNPMEFRQGFNNTDRLHPNDAGYKAMAEAIDLSLFTAKGSAARR